MNHIQHLTNMQMTFENIFDTLKHSVGYEEFIIDYNDLITEISKEKTNSLNEWKLFIKKKNELKKKFYNDYCKEYPIKVVRMLRESKYIYDIDVSKEIQEIEKIINPIVNFKKRLRQLQ